MEEPSDQVTACCALTTNASRLQQMLPSLQLPLLLLQLLCLPLHCDWAESMATGPYGSFTNSTLQQEQLCQHNGIRAPGCSWLTKAAKCAATHL